MSFEHQLVVYSFASAGLKRFRKIICTNVCAYFWMFDLNTFFLDLNTFMDYFLFWI